MIEPNYFFLIFLGILVINRYPTNLSVFGMWEGAESGGGNQQRNGLNQKLFSYAVTVLPYKL